MINLQYMMIQELSRMASIRLRSLELLKSVDQALKDRKVVPSIFRVVDREILAIHHRVRIYTDRTIHNDSVIYNLVRSSL